MRICRLMDCRKLSSEACTHAMQNERLPFRVVLQVLFFEQVRATAYAGNSTPDLPGSIRALLPGGSQSSSRSTTTNTEDEWDSVPTAEDIKTLKGELATLRFGSNRSKNDAIKSVAVSRMKGLVMSKILSKLYSGKDYAETSSSNTSESPGSINAEETKSSPSTSRKHALTRTGTCVV